MQVNPKEIKEQIELLQKSWIELPDGKFINKLDDVPTYYNIKEMEEKLSASVDATIAIFGNDAKTEVEKYFKGYKSLTRVVNKKSKKPIKREIEKVEFDAILRANKEVIRKMNLNFNERAVYKDLCSFCYGKDNVVTIDNEIPTLTQLSEEIGLKERTLTKHLQSLEDKGLIIRENFMHKKMIYLNPIYYTTHLDFLQLATHTKELFNLM